MDAAVAGDEVLVNDGVYRTGGRSFRGLGATNRVFIDKAITLRSVNGPRFTLVVGAKDRVSHGTGASAVRGVQLSPGATLSGFTVTNGATTYPTGPYDVEGGGILVKDYVNGGVASTNAIITNCIIVANDAYSAGGGVSGGTLFNCTLKGNTAGAVGGGAAFAALHNCFLTGNGASGGGGAAYGYLYSCTLTGNQAGAGEG